MSNQGHDLACPGMTWQGIMHVKFHLVSVELLPKYIPSLQDQAGLMSALSRGWCDWHGGIPFQRVEVVPFDIAEYGLEFQCEEKN